MWGWDRKISPKDHRLASRGLSSDDKWWLRSTDFSIPSSHKKYIPIFLLTIKHRIFILNLLQYAEMRHNMMMSLSQNNNLTAWSFDVRLFLFLSLMLRVGNIDFSHMGKYSQNHDLVCKKLIVHAYVLIFHFLTDWRRRRTELTAALNPQPPTNFS